MSKKPRLTWMNWELKDYIRESVEFIQRYEPTEGYFVGFSGGKDSIVLLELCRMADVKYYAYYTCTRIDPPEVYKFIKTYYPDVVWLYPRLSFFGFMQHRIPPLPWKRWCCQELKENPSKRVPLKHRLLGLRAEESARRASRPRVDIFNSKQVLYKPIFWWTEWLIWEFIESRGLPYPSLYDEGWNRVGCVFCPFLLGPSAGAEKRRSRNRERWPGIWKAVEHTIKAWWRRTHGKNCSIKFNHETADSYWESYLRLFK